MQEKKHPKKAVHKTEKKPHAKKSAAATSAHEKKEKVKKEKPKALMQRLKAKNSAASKKKIRAKLHAMFRGRFGSKTVRKITREKWQKWRRPRGMDIFYRREFGRVVDTGYRSDTSIRGLHPSGFREQMVHNPMQLVGIDRETTAARIGATVGKRKRKDIIKKAIELGVKILN